MLPRLLLIALLLLSSFCSSADNRGALARFSDVEPGDDGAVVLDVEVSPAGSSRFAYLGALILSRIE